MLFCFLTYMIGRCANGAPQSVSHCIMIKCSLVILRTVIISNATFCCKTLGPGISIHLNRRRSRPVFPDGIIFTQWKWKYSQNSTWQSIQEWLHTIKSSDSSSIKTKECVGKNWSKIHHLTKQKTSDLLGTLQWQACCPFSHIGMFALLEFFLVV